MKLKSIHCADFVFQQMSL